MKSRFMFTLLNILFLSTLFQTAAVAGEERPIIGTVENTILEDTDTKLKARIDTGAGLASINAEILEVKQNPTSTEERVTFKIKDAQGKDIKTLERPIIKWINIKKKGSNKFNKRPVVKLDFCIGGKRVEARTNLADRSNFLYPVLIGRNVLKAGDFMIDPKKKFTHKPSSCH